MKIELHNITIGELTAGYRDSGNEGVVGYGGKLDIRPPYQREFIYDEKPRNAVIHSVINEFPLNTMYWSVTGDGTFELMDGQQRSISIAQYIHNKFRFGDNYFKNLTPEEKKQILDYKLSVYFCTGTQRERLDWFETINIAGKPLTDQEMRNAMFVGKWVADAKKYFSKPGCPASREEWKLYLSGRMNRQEYLETALEWIRPNSKEPCEEYMAEHQHDETADELWKHFQAVISWVKQIFPKYRVEMKGVNWGTLYANHKDDDLDPDKLEAECKDLMINEEIQRKKGIYFYLLTREEKHLNLRIFDSRQKRVLFEKAEGKCQQCGAEIKTLNEAHADHIDPWSKGGRTEIENGQILCRKCNQSKSNK